MEIEIYTKAYCPYCERAKELLRIKGIAFTEYVINADPVCAEELRRRGEGNSVPKIFIAGQLVGGCSELFELDENGTLDRLFKGPPGLP